MNRLTQVGIPVAVVALGMVGATLLVKMGKPPKSEPRVGTPPTVQVVEAQLGRHSFVVYSQGAVAPGKRVVLVSQVAARVKTVSPAFEVGGFFRKGDLLLQLDTFEYELVLARTRALVAQAHLHLEMEKEESAAARKEWELLGQGEPSGLNAREPQLAEALAALEAAQAGEQKAQLDIARCRFEAPFDGMVASVGADTGQFVALGTQVGEVFSTGHAEVRLPLPVDQLTYLNLPKTTTRDGGDESGLGVVLSARVAGETVTWQGKVVRSEGKVDPLNRMVHLVARVEDPYGRDTHRERQSLMAGLFVQAKISGKTVDDVFVLPRNALRGRDEIWVVRNGKLDIRKTEVLQAGRDSVVLRTGLAPNDQVCISLVNGAHQGMPVQPRPTTRELKLTAIDE